MAIKLDTKKVMKFIIDHKLQNEFFDEFNNEFFREALDGEMYIDCDGHFIELVEAVDWLVDNELSFAEWEEFLNDLQLSLIWDYFCFMGKDNGAS